MMLYILNKTAADSLRQLEIIGAGDGEKAVLLISDGVFLAQASQAARLKNIGVEDLYAAEDAVEARHVDLPSGVELVDYDDMAGLFEEHDKIIML